MRSVVDAGAALVTRRVALRVCSRTPSSCPTRTRRKEAGDVAVQRLVDDAAAAVTVATVATVAAAAWGGHRSEEVVAPTAS